MTGYGFLLLGTIRKFNKGEMDRKREPFIDICRPHTVGNPEAATGDLAGHTLTPWYFVSFSNGTRFKP